MPETPEWYAVYTCSKAEKHVATELGKADIEHYLPLQVTMRQWTDRKKKVLVPLIRSYVFIHVTPKDFMKVVKVWGVVKILFFDGKPVPIPDWQINNLKILLGARVPMETDVKAFKKGRDVRITHGVLKDLRGKILEIKGQHKLLISITALDYNLTIDIDPTFVEPFEEEN
jgi:transcription antitermination factor NusG